MTSMSLRALLLVLLLRVPPAHSAPALDGDTNPAQVCEATAFIWPKAPAACRSALALPASYPGAATASSLADCINACQEQGPPVCAGNVRSSRPILCLPACCTPWGSLEPWSPVRVPPRRRPRAVLAMSVLVDWRSRLASRRWAGSKVLVSGPRARVLGARVRTWS